MRMFWWMDDDKVYDSLFSVVYTFIYIAQQAVSLRPKVSFFFHLFVCFFSSLFGDFSFLFFPPFFFVLLRLVVGRSAMYLLFFLVFLWNIRHQGMWVTRLLVTLGLSIWSGTGSQPAKLFSSTCGRPMRADSRRASSTWCLSYWYPYNPIRLRKSRRTCHEMDGGTSHKSGRVRIAAGGTTIRTTHERERNNQRKHFVFVSYSEV